MNKETLPTTWEEVCQKAGIDPNQLPDVSWMPQDLQPYMIAAYKLAIIHDVLNEGWVPDWSNSNEYKYYAWWNMNDSNAPLGFSYYGYVCAFTYTSLGARQFLKSSELVEHAAEHFIDVYRDFHVRPK